MNLLLLQKINMIKAYQAQWFFVVNFAFDLLVYYEASINLIIIKGDTNEFKPILTSFTKLST